jgi:hypothetical protein
VELDLTLAEVGAYYQLRATKIRQSNRSEWRGPCPIHGGTRDSFAVEAATGRWVCHSECGGAGGDVIELERRLTGADFMTARDAVFAIIGRPAVNGNGRGTAGYSPSQWREVAKYPYTDEAGNLMFRVIRRERGEGARHEKTFYQERFEDGGWRRGLGNVRRVPYHLDEVVDQELVFIAEGEKDVDRLRSGKLCATCNPMGAGKWSKDYTPHFAGKDVAIFPDNDEPGRRHAAHVAGELLGVARTVQIIELPGLPPKGDFSDWADAGGETEDLERLILETPVLTSSRLTELRLRWGLVPDGPAAQSERLQLPEVVDGFALYHSDLSETVFVVPGLLSRGLTILAGRPKSGKSWFALELAVSVATGRAFLEWWKVDRPGAVLYLALEEPRSRTRSRLRKVSPPEVSLQNIHFAYSLLPLMGGGAELLDAMLARFARFHPQLVVIDTFTALVGQRAGKNTDVFGSQYAEVNRLRELADKHEVALLLIHHTRKGTTTGDGIEAVAGTGGLTAAADSIWVLRQQADGERTLEVVSREMEEKTIGLRFSGCETPGKAFGWEVVGEGDEFLLSAERREIVDLIRDEGPMNAKKLAQTLRKNYSTVRGIVSRLATAGDLTRRADGAYSLWTCP